MRKSKFSEHQIVAILKAVEADGPEGTFVASMSAPQHRQKVAPMLVHFTRSIGGGDVRAEPVWPM